MGWVFPAQDIPQAAFWHWELAFPVFPSPFPAGFKPLSHLKGVQSCLWNVEYPGWMKHGASSGCGLSWSTSGCGFAPLGLSTGSGKPWRKTQVLFSFKEQEGKQLPDPSCLLPGGARAAIHQVFPAINTSCCFAGAQKRQPRLEN